MPRLRTPPTPRSSGIVQQRTAHDFDRPLNVLSDRRKRKASADEDDGPSQQVSKRARVEEAPAKPPSAAEAVSRAAADAAAKQQRRAQERADEAIRQCEERREGRAEAVAARSRVAGRCIQLKAVAEQLLGAARRHRVPRPQRSRERLSEAPPDVLLAFDELQELEAQLQSAGS